MFWLSWWGTRLWKLPVDQGKTIVSSTWMMHALVTSTFAEILHQNGGSWFRLDAFGISQAVAGCSKI